MFDTSVVRARAATAPQRFTLFGISVALHTAIAIAVIASTIASVDFPNVAPDQIAMFQMATQPPMPKGDPNGGAKPPEPRKPDAPKPEPVKVPVTPAEQTAPQEIPETTNPIEDLTASAGEASTGTGSGTSDLPFGDPDGVDGGIGTEPGGGLIAGPAETIIHRPGGEVTRAQILRRVEPRYPPLMQRVGFKTAIVIVQCVIDRTGKCRTPTVLKSTHPGFDQSVLDAVQQWTFKPGALRGQPVDTWFELTVTFQMR